MGKFPGATFNGCRVIERQLIDDTVEVFRDCFVFVKSSVSVFEYSSRELCPICYKL